MGLPDGLVAARKMPHRFIDLTSKERARLRDFHRLRIETAQLVLAALPKKGSGIRLTPLELSKRMTLTLRVTESTEALVALETADQEGARS